MNDPFAPLTRGTRIVVIVGGVVAKAGQAGTVTRKQRGNLVYVRLDGDDRAMQWRRQYIARLAS